MSPVQGAALVHGMCGVLPLDGVRESVNLSITAPSVEVGERLAIATTGDMPDSWQSEHWRLLWRGARSDEAILSDGAGSKIPLHRRSVIGSVTATTPALPIVSADDFDSTDYELPACLRLSPNRQYLDYWPEGAAEDDESTDLSSSLPWLGGDLVGRWAVLTRDAATTEQRCPNCEGIAPGAWICAVCNGERTCPPVPMPADLTAGTLTELETT